jgi:hypothetical protein
LRGPSPTNCWWKHHNWHRFVRDWWLSSFWNSSISIDDKCWHSRSRSIRSISGICWNIWPRILSSITTDCWYIRSSSRATGKSTVYFPGQWRSRNWPSYVNRRSFDHSKANAQIARWRPKSYVNWAGSSPVSHKSCSETRVQQFKKAKKPPASEDPNEACAHCVASKILCVLVGKNGPVVVPLPVSERSPGATPTSGEYYVKE